MSDAPNSGKTSAEIWRHLDSLTKPPRSLGCLEDLAARLCTIQQTLAPQTKPRRLVLFAGDHGVVRSGVSAWPSTVTGLMVRNILAGRAASSVLAAQTGTQIAVVDVGASDHPVEAALDGAPTWQPHEVDVAFRGRRVRAGTSNLADGPAMAVAEFEQALEAGRAEARLAGQAECRVVAAGEMGIGNTTPAACLAMLLADVPLEQAVGRGAGADDETLVRKRRIVELAVARSRSRLREGDVVAMADVGGFEIVAMAGFYLEAGALGMTIVLDGYISAAAALIAERLAPGTMAFAVASHLSAEPGHRLVLRKLRLTPFLEWQLRLGEGTGALLLMPLLDAAAVITRDMATFADLGIVTQADS